MVCCVSGDQSDHQSNVSIFPPSGGRQTVYYGGAANVIKSISGGHSQDKQISRGELEERRGQIDGYFAWDPTSRGWY